MSTKIGLQGEKAAAQFLKNQGYKIILKNFRAAGGEVDIIARDGSTLVFVEVKTRNTNRFGEAHWSLDLRKRKHLTRVAMAYMTKEQVKDTPCRFDLVVLERGQWNEVPHFELIRNAFDAEM